MSGRASIGGPSGVYCSKLIPQEVVWIWLVDVRAAIQGANVFTFVVHIYNR